MLDAQMYRGLVETLKQRDWHAVTSPQDYEACHHLVGWADKLASLTPRSMWIPHKPPFTHQELRDLLQSFDGPVIVKDYVKSEKHAWTQACFIPDTCDIDQALGVINRFIELRDRNFEGGLVLREFVRLKPIGEDERSGMPLSRELRSFWMGTTCIAVSDYWRNDSSDPLPQVAGDAARLIERPFFTIDVAMTDAGEWIVIEVGDGQVSALPDSLDASTLYAGLVGR
ncbi:MAG TPA: ATP-grasp domain-containing protein [Phycisphaerales bacterium]|nr:ATP-grasp domain-containing protein [Phycisphaerales bacterium]